MLIAMTVTSLFVIAAIATGASLLDSWLRGRVAFAILQRERQWVRAGFVPQVEPQATRLRQTFHHEAKRRTGRSTARPTRRGFGGAARSRLGAVQALG